MVRHENQDFLPMTMGRSQRKLTRKIITTPIGSGGSPLDMNDVTLGVLAARRNSTSRPYHAQTTFFRRLIRSAEEIGVQVFVFSPPGIHWKSRRISGWTWTGKRWVKRLYRFPDAIYDRVSPKGKADLGGISTVRRRFKNLGIPRFNTGIGCKWKMHRLFSKNPHLQPILPPTTILTKSSLARMIGRYGSIYSKPVRGGQGKGVIWAAKSPSGYRYRIQGSSRSVSGRVSTMSGLRSRCGSGRRIVQKAIPILRCEGHPFDIRALIQRGEDGEWHLTGLVARLGGKQSRVTNIHAGGKALQLDDALRRSGANDEQITQLIEDIGRLAHEVAETIAGAGALVGELGVDFAIDTDFNIWLLEANSRTGRISFHRAGLKDAAVIADRAPAAYAKFLASLKR